MISLFDLLYGDEAIQADVEATLKEIHRYATGDYHARLKVLSVAKAIRTATLSGDPMAWAQVINEAETELAALVADGFGLLAGLTSALVADFLATIHPAGERLATGARS